MEYILNSLAAGILKIELNRPQKRNALTIDMYTEFAELLNSAQVKPEIRVVLVSAAGDNYSAGNDLQDFLDHPPGSGDSPQRKLIDALRVLDKPLVGAIRGAAVGSGATMLTYFDFVYASQNARFQYPFINLALVPEFGTSFSLPDQVGYLRAAEIVLLGHPFDASTALSLGLVTKVLPDAEVLATAEKTTQELAQKPLAALKASKRLLRSQFRPCVEQATQDEMLEFSERVRSADAREALTAFFEKRRPRFNTGETP
jgi:enoyl-CoA hydratase/carnithine racemase